MATTSSSTDVKREAKVEAKESDLWLNPYLIAKDENKVNENLLSLSFKKGISGTANVACFKREQMMNNLKSEITIALNERNRHQKKALEKIVKLKALKKLHKKMKIARLIKEEEVKQREECSTKKMKIDEEYKREKMNLQRNLFDAIRINRDQYAPSDERTLYNKFMADQV